MKNLPLLLHQDLLISGNNLLAFSYGLDSTALFHLLYTNNINFDLAMINYGVRSLANQEEKAARELARKFGKKIHIIRAPRWKSAFEENARIFRYNFFEKLIDRKGYDNLLTAHQLDDRFSWLLMRLARGAGAVEITGMESLSIRTTPGGTPYRLIRPLLECSRQSLSDFLNTKSIPYFEDESNLDGSNERSRLEKFVNDFTNANTAGLLRSFRYLERDRNSLLKGWSLLFREKDLSIFRILDSTQAARAADSALKKHGYLLSGKERLRINQGESLVAGRKWAVELYNDLLYLAPYLQYTVPRSYREQCRQLGIPPKVRPYCYRANLDPDKLTPR